MPKSPSAAPATLALGALALCAVLPLGGCNRSHANHAAAQNATQDTAQAATLAAPRPVDDPVQTPIGPRLQPVANPSNPMPADPCPSIGTLAETRGVIVFNGVRMVRLSTVCSAEAMTAHLRNFGAGTRFILVADDLRAGVQPGSLFELRLGPPSTGEEAVLGTLNFFAARRPGGPGQPHSVSYDVTRQVQSLAVSGWPARGLGVAIAPSGAVAPGTDASVGALRLVAEAPR